MAFFPRSCMMLSLAATATAQAFSTTPGQLEAKVTLQTNSSWHLGGFCLGQAGPETTKAAEIQAHVEWEGQQQLSQTGPVMLAAFDAREDRWGAVKDAWGQMTCEEKLSAASMHRHLGKNHSYTDFTFRINVHQTSAIRDWHFAVLTCGETEQAVLTLRLVATNGVLNMFEANTHFDASSCPVVDVPWLSAAHDEAGFWLMLVGALLLGCSAVLVAVSCRHCRKKVQIQQFRETATAGGAEHVIGRPCSQIGGAKIVDGQTTVTAHATCPAQPWGQDMTGAGKGAAAPDSRV